MSSRTAPEVSRAFAQATAALRDVRLRPEIELEEVPAPQRVAPHSVAYSGDVVLAGSEDSLAAGRFVVLHDPSVPEAWESDWRIVSFVRAEMEPELAGDPMLGEVGWSWLTDALDNADVDYRALGGTVTRVVNDSFAALSERDSTVEMEVRASWSPLDGRLTDHLLAWTELLCTLAGLPPLPDGVSALPGRHR